MAKTQSREDYLKAIYHLAQEQSPVATSTLAAHLRLGDGSVSGMLKTLSGQKLIRHERYRGVALTPAGKKLALALVRRHRLWEMFLVRYLGFAWDEIHDEAERLEHATSEELTQRLDRLLGYPVVDPHGDPIPDRHGELRRAAARPLSEFTAGDEVQIVRISDRERRLLMAARAKGLLLKTRLKVRRRADADGSIAVNIGRRELTITRALAEALFVDPV